jgi:hypothetical protein
MTAKTSALFERIIERVKFIAVQEIGVAFGHTLIISDNETTILAAMESLFSNTRV